MLEDNSCCHLELLLLETGICINMHAVLTWCCCDSFSGDIPPAKRSKPLHSAFLQTETSMLKVQDTTKPFILVYCWHADSSLVACVQYTWQEQHRAHSGNLSEFHFSILTLWQCLKAKEVSERYTVCGHPDDIFFRDEPVNSGRTVKTHSASTHATAVVNAWL